MAKPNKPILAFHGTRDVNIDNIVQNNFDISQLGTNTGNKGYYGCGLYFSEYTSTSLGYNKGGNRMLLSKVLLGTPYACPGRMDGAPIQPGFDSHLSPCGQEVVIYDNAQILPCYILHYKPGQTLGK